MIKRVLFLACIGALLSGCDRGPESPRGFSLPEGDAVQGEQVFVKYQCLNCHTLEGFTRENYTNELDTPVRLGGSTARIKTYAELVTSVINPSHKLAKFYRAENISENGQSKMRNFNDVMTVSELVDLVSFLQPHYTLRQFDRTYYVEYPPHQK